MAPGPDRERVLIRHLAGLMVVMMFERVYSLIWGSQIGVLQFLNSAGPAGVSAEFLRPWFDQAVAREPDAYAGDTLDVGSLSLRATRLSQGKARTGLSR